MAQFQTSHFHDGWYDTQFSMPALLQHPYPYHPPYHTSPPLQVPQYSPWINSLQLHKRPPPPPYTPQPPTSKPSPAATTTPATTLPYTRPLRSILKRPRSTPPGPQMIKFVHFHPLTASPVLAAPGTYKHSGRPKSPRLRHPARFHPCLGSTVQQPVNEAIPAAPTAHPAPQQQAKQASNTSTQRGLQPRSADSITRPRPPTPPPAAFFHTTNNAQAQATPQVQRPPHQPNTSASRQPQQPAALRTIPKAQTATIRTNGELSSTDIRLAKRAAVVLKTPNIKVSDARKVEATRRSLQALAREFDRKNAWRRGGG